MIVIGGWHFTTKAVKAAATSSATIVAVMGLCRVILNMAQFPCRAWHLAWLYCSRALELQPQRSTCCPVCWYYCCC